jgi:hypothetical protein
MYRGFPPPAEKLPYDIHCNGATKSPTKQICSLSEKCVCISLQKCAAEDIEMTNYTIFRYKNVSKNHIS